MRELNTAVLVVGGGLGGVAAALAAVENDTDVILTEEYAWLGGQSTSQAVPFDEHPWIEEIGATARYRRLRTEIREHYRRDHPLTARARAQEQLNPGAGWVSKLCHEPRAAVIAIDNLLAEHLASGRLRVLQPARPVAAETDGDRITSVTLDHDGEQLVVTAGYVLDATETGDLLSLAGVEYVLGFEANSEHDEPSAPEVAQPENIQAISICFAVDHLEGADFTIDRPADYDYWRSVQPADWGGRLLSWTSPDPRTLQPIHRSFTPNPDEDPFTVDADQSKDPGAGNLWTYRRILARKLFQPGTHASDVIMVNWPMIDYFDHPVIDVPDADVRLEEARQLSLSALYWMQTEAPRADGGTGWPGLRLRPDVTGTDDGLAMAPYHREARRIRALRTVSERDVSLAITGGPARQFDDSVGIGMYRIDLHPSTGGDNYIDVASAPFQLPLGFLIPQRMQNLLAAGKTSGTTHITNGCYRLHPVEWNTGEVAGILAAHCLAEGVTPHQVHENPTLIENFQRLVMNQGIELSWPDGVSGY